MVVLPPVLPPPLDWTRASCQSDCLHWTHFPMSEQHRSNWMLELKSRLVDHLDAVQIISCVNGQKVNQSIVKVTETG